MGDTSMSAEESAEFSLDITACTAAEAFIDAYYYALEKERNTIYSFYCPNQIAADSTVPFIAWNSEVYNDGANFQEHFEQLTHTHFEIESMDCHIINPKFLPAVDLKGGSGDDTKDFNRRMAFSVVVAGSVRLEEQLKGPMREFAETFVLVPNVEKQLPPRPSFEKGWQQEWLIQTQNFRFTEWGASEVGDTRAGDAKVNGGVKNVFQGRNQSVAKHFAAAGLTIKGKGKT